MIQVYISVKGNFKTQHPNDLLERQDLQKWDMIMFSVSTGGSVEHFTQTYTRQIKTPSFGLSGQAAD